jgi:hypothetical protein
VQNLPGCKYAYQGGIEACTHVHTGAAPCPSGAPMGGGGQPKSDIRADAMALASSERSNAFIFNYIKPSVRGGEGGGGGFTVTKCVYQKYSLITNECLCLASIPVNGFMLPS